MTLLIRLLVNALGLWVAVQLIDGLSFSGSVWALLLIALVFGVVNAVVRPIVKVLSLPLLVLSLGLFSLVINAVMFALVIWLSGPERLDLGLETEGFGSTFLGALVVSVIGWAASQLIKDDR